MTDGRLRSNGTYRSALYALLRVSAIYNFYVLRPMFIRILLTYACVTDQVFKKLNLLTIIDLT